MDGQWPPGKEIIVTRPPIPTRTLRERPDLDQLKRQAKELLQSFKDGESVAAAEVSAHYHGADPSTFALHDAQLVIARSYGFDSCSKLKAFVDGASVKRLIDPQSVDITTSHLWMRLHIAGTKSMQNDSPRSRRCS